MKLALTYGTPSGVETGGGKARVRLAGAKERDVVRWRGAVKDPLAVREALLALHDVVGADFRWRPRESRAEFRRWLTAFLDRHAASERATLDADRRRALEWRFTEARGEAWIVLDPVVSVHPDQVIFEAFSRDGAAYGRVGLDRAATTETGPVQLGTTNVDFSSGLYEAVRRLRTIWRTELAVGSDPEAAGEGLEVTTMRDAGDGATVTHREKQVELPDAWVRGFVQLGAAAMLEAVKVELRPVHAHDICRHLRLHRAKASPRALRWELTPGQPAEVVFEPWETRLVLHGSKHGAAEPRVIRTWGRDRWRLVERAVALARTVEVHLLGRGLPYFVVARGAGVDFTLGLSGWTRADWTSSARFDALVARRRPGTSPSPRPAAWLEAHRRGTPAEVAAGAGTTLADANAALVDAATRGLAIYDLVNGVWRWRPLVPGGVPAGLGLGDDPAETAARALVARGAATITGTKREGEGGTRVSGRVVEDATHTWEPSVLLSDEGRVTAADCQCFPWKQSGLKGGPCAHQRAVLLLNA